MKAAFDHVRSWVFDLDNTLYPASVNLFARIDERMTAFIAAELEITAGEAYTLQKATYEEHGATLKGLMLDHGVCPRSFMDYVHEIDVSDLLPDDRLRAGLASLPGRRFIHTNGSVAHAENVAGKLGVLDLIEDIFDPEAGGWEPKPAPDNHKACIDRFGLDPKRAAMFEDSAANLAEPHRCGMVTVLVADTPRALDHVDFHTSDLPAFLNALTA